ncbi:MAG: FeoB-associated Cys-rich membrane protein [Clostridia bacterium]|nr:FeoB-associated Cys-rich membrane protein [Clostridia bacterium]
MLNWLQNNIGTIAVCAVLVVLFGAVIVRMIKNKKAGKSSCGCGCSECAMHGQCHGAAESKSE